MIKPTGSNATVSVACAVGVFVLGVLASWDSSLAEFRLPRATVVSGAGSSAVPPMTVFAAVGTSSAGWSSGGAWTLLTGPLLPGSSATSSVAFELPSKTQLLGVLPNPTSADPAIEFQIASSEGDASVRAEIFDVSGRRVRALPEESLSSGVYRRALSLNDGTRGMANGVYMLRLRIGEETFRTRFVVLR